MLQVRDQVAQLAAENGLKVSDGIASSLLPTVKARDSNPEGYEAGLRRGMPQLGTMVKAIVDGDDRLDLLPTPNTMEHREIKTPEQIAEMKAKSPGGYRNLRESVINELLPTPQAMEGAKGNNLSVADRAATGQVMLSNYAVEIATNGPAAQSDSLLPTATSNDWKGANNSGGKSTSAQGLATAIDNLPEISWGKFEPAIRRWERVLDRPAPAPTKPDGKDGNHRLAAEFTEWMMGLPAGHVTDPLLGLTRVEMLKLCGNGVVPQQAKLALQILLEGVDW
jgi:DNA (cytosine-5)-methyltransferase 1